MKMRSGLSLSKHKKSQIYMYDILVALVLSILLFYVSLSQFITSEFDIPFVTLSESYNFVKFLSSTEISDLVSVDSVIESALGLSIKEGIIKPETSIAETILALYYVNETRLDRFLDALDDFIFDEYGRFNYWISLSNSTDKFFYNHTNVDDISSYLKSNEFTSSSTLVTYGNFTKIYGPAILTVTVWKNETISD